MFGHKDIPRTSSWQAQITGYKRWHLCSAHHKTSTCACPIFSSFIQYCLHLTILFYTILGQLQVQSRRMWTLLTLISEKWPNFEKANCIDDVAAPGEMIFYPKDYWHQTRNVARRGRKPSRVGHWNSGRRQQLPRSLRGSWRGNAASMIKEGFRYQPRSVEDPR